MPPGIGRRAGSPPMRRPGVALAATLVIAVGMTGLVAAAGAQPPTMAWLDAPLPGSVLPDGPVKVVAHAAHPSGIVRVELLADGALVEARDGGDTLPAFLAVTFDWAPPAPGPHTLAVRAMSAATGWSDAAGAGITIDADLVAPTDRPTETVTPDGSPGPSSSPGRSTSPSPTASGPSTPGPTTAPGGT
ncbi:MAG: Ig-like domain-containing protein, partial [Chloroflexota bacterium]